METKDLICSHLISKSVVCAVEKGRPERGMTNSRLSFLKWLLVLFGSIDFIDNYCSTILPLLQL